jgi:hypothetical protein
MAAPKKTSTTAKKTAGKTPTKKAPATKADPVQDVIELVRGFQVNTMIAMALAVLLFVFQLFPDLTYLWWLNIATAAASGYMFWRQGDLTTGNEQKVCRWGLLAVVAIFLWRDIYISQQLNEIANFDFENPFSNG